jgi:hypothetical protein
VDGAEKLAARVRGVPVPDAKRRRSALLAARAEEPPAAELCIPAEARFAERSFAAVEAQMAEQQDAPLWEPMAERSLKFLKALPLLELVRPEVASPSAPACSRATMRMKPKPVTKPQVPPQRAVPEQPVAEPPKLAEP